MENLKPLSDAEVVPMPGKVSVPIGLISLVVIVIALMSLIPGSALPAIYVTAGSVLGIPAKWINSNMWAITNYGHFFTSGVLTYLIVLRYPTHWFSFFLLILFSLATIECLQYFIPLRQASLCDFLYDFSGSLVSLFFVHIQILWFDKRKKK